MIKNNKRRCMFFFIMILLLFIFLGCGSASDEAASSSDPKQSGKAKSAKINPQGMVMYPNTKCWRKF